MSYTFAATCLFGLEKLLGEELDALNLERTETIDGRVYFKGDAVAAVRANLWLRTAERVYLVVGRFPARTFTELFDGTKDLPWEEFIRENDEFPVTGHAIKSQLFSVPDCQSIIKKAIVTRLGSVYGINRLPEDGKRARVEFFLFKDEAALMIDTSGLPLHKRGYRPEAGIAPLRETLGAALATIARPREDTLFWDPFCGSGTIAIEAAMIVTRRAPGLERDFAGEDFDWIPHEAWKSAREEARSLFRANSAFEAYASDYDPNMVKLAQSTVDRASMGKYIKVFQADARRIAKEDRRGTVVCNPPYGERLLDRENAERLYREIGKPFCDLAPWQVYVLTSCETFERLYGRRADKTRKLYNGMIPCKLYEFYKPAEFRTDSRPPRDFNYKRPLKK